MQGDDWTIVVGANTKAAEDKVNKLEKKIEHLGRGSSSKSSSDSREANRLRKSRQSALRTLNILNKKGGVDTAEERSYRKKIKYAKTLGTLEKHRAAISDRVIELDRKGIHQGRKSLDVAKREAAVRARASEAFDKTKKRGKAADTIVGSREALRGTSGLKASEEMLQLSNRVKATRDKVRQLGKALKGATSKDELIQLSYRLDRAGRAASRATTKLNRLTNGMRTQAKQAGHLKQSIRHLVHSYASIFALGAGIKGFFNTGRDMESINAIMLASADSAQQAANNFDFVVSKSRELGINLKESAMGYAKLGAAAKGAGMTSAETRDLFTGISEAAIGFGLNPQRTNLTFLAIQQMLSKGVVSMEELRRQLGEQIPGAFQIAAKAVGVQTNELNELVASGKLESVAFVKALTAELGRSVKETGALQAALHKVRAEQERSKTELTLGISDGFADSAHLFAAGFRMLADSFNNLRPALAVIGKLLSSTFVVLAGALKVVTSFTQIFFTAINNLFVMLLGSRALNSATGEVGLMASEFGVLGKAVAYATFGLELFFAVLSDVASLMSIQKGDSGLVRTAKYLVSASVAIAGIFVASRFKWVRTLFGFIKNTVQFALKGVKEILAAVGLLKGLKMVGGKAASSAGKGLASSTGKSTFARAIPFVGAGLFAKDAYDSFSDGETAKGFAHSLAAVVSLIPAASIGKGLLLGAGAMGASATGHLMPNSTTTTVGDINIYEATNPGAVADEVGKRLNLIELSGEAPVF